METAEALQQTTSENYEKKFCEMPFRWFELGSNFSNEETYLCCPAWLKKSIGHFPAKSFDEIWNSDEAQDIRRSILDGSFEYCDKTRCPKILSGQLPNASDVSDVQLQNVIAQKTTRLDFLPEIVNLANDRSCNLSCPSCRTEKIDIREGPIYEQMKARQEKLLNEILPGIKHLQVTGSGDPFGSRLYRELLVGLKGENHPNLLINLTTNGVMFTPQMWEKLKGIHANINIIKVSVDSATEETYSIVRRGGSFSKLLSNIEYLGHLRRQGAFKWFQLDFVVQARNYKEMVGFIEIGERVGADCMFFQKIVNWNTFSEEEFSQHAVWQEAHPEHQQFLIEFQSPQFASSKVELGNCFPYRKQ